MTCDVCGQFSALENWGVEVRTGQNEKWIMCSSCLIDSGDELNEALVRMRKKKRDNGGHQQEE
jgi:hypothetical protein